jgi:hypothetical protein
MDRYGMNQPTSEPISACVICYNRVAIVETCLRALQFADELIVVDKSSIDGTREIAERYADRLIVVPWTPTVEETRAEAIALCSHNWIVILDDDECLSPDAIRFIVAEMTEPGADIYAIPVRHYVIGRHDERAYYWPEHHYRLFRKGTLRFTRTVHGGIVPLSSNIRVIPPETGICIHNLSHASVGDWVEKVNRYTAQPTRVSGFDPAVPLSRDFALKRIAFWLRKQGRSDDGYLTAVALLKGIYDIVDRLKRWESETGQDGHEAFDRVCAALHREYDLLYQSLDLRSRRLTGAMPSMEVETELRVQPVQLSAEQMGPAAAGRAPVAASADLLTYVEYIRLLACEFEIRTNSQDVAHGLSYITQRAEQDVPVVQHRTMTVTWTADEFQLSGDGIDDFELSATSAVETLYQHLHHGAIAAMPDHIRMRAATGMHAAQSFLIVGPPRAGKTTLALRLMLGGLDISGDELALLHEGMVVAFPRKFQVAEDSLALMPNLTIMQPYTPAIINPQESRFVGLDPPGFGKPWRIAPAPVSAVLYIEPNFGGRSTLRRSGKVEMVRRVLPHCALPISGRQDWLGDLCATINRAEAFVIELGDLNSASSAIIEVLSGPSAK